MKFEFKQPSEFWENKQIQRIYVPRHYCLLFKWYPVSINFDSKNARKMPKLK